MTDKQNTPPCQIRIDKEGVWYYQGAEMFRREFVNFFYQHLHRDAEGHYVIELPNDRCYVEVEDTAYFVKAVHTDNGHEGASGGSLRIMLCDDTWENLNPETLYVGRGNVLYCEVRGGKFPARFSRAAYYQLAEHIDQDADNGTFFLRCQGRRYDIGRRF